MGGMDNKTSLEACRIKADIIEYHTKRNIELFKEYIETPDVYTKTFLEWKEEKKKYKRKKEKMQKPLSEKQLKERGYNTRLSLNNIRWK